MKQSKISFLIFLIIFFLFFVFLFSVNISSASNNLNIYFFWGNGCPHCAKQEEYLNVLKKDYSNISIYDFEIYENSNNILLLQKISQKLDIRVDGVPFTIIGNKQYVGFSEYSTPKELKNRIEYCLNNKCLDSVAEIVGLENPDSKNQEIIKQDDPIVSNNLNEQTEQQEKYEKDITFPFIGKINPSSFSLPVLTIIMGGLDGFNPCAMWTLLFLISLLLGMQDKKRMWILGAAFIVVSASVYFLFMAAWLNLILFLGFIIWLRIIIGLIALLGGSYNLKEFFINKNTGCKVTNNEKRQKIFDKIKNITQLHSFWLALGGIIILAFAVNLVELICSAGLPAVYTQILVLSNLTKWQYYLYIALYIFIFMLDDLFIFFTAMITLQITGITTKYTRLSKLVGGLLMLAIGLLLIFKPELLMFG